LASLEESKHIRPDGTDDCGIASKDMPHDIWVITGKNKTDGSVIIGGAVCNPDYALEIYVPVVLKPKYPNYEFFVCETIGNPEKYEPVKITPAVTPNRKEYNEHYGIKECECSGGGDSHDE
jgi:hypothetical protein